MSQKFFCDNCGEQVKKDESRCPHCGRYFRSVKCPACDFAGSSSLFTDGCPICGYAGEGSNPSAFIVPPEPEKPRRLFSGRFYKALISAMGLIFVFLLIWLFKILGS